MTAEERADAVAALGFTVRQARFLVKVMTHSGVCLPRQYTAFAGIVFGQRTRRFFARLVGSGYASTCGCLHNRALVYHVHGGALYRAIGEPRSRLRRTVPATAVVPRLMLLDAVLARPETTWLVEDEERRESLAKAPAGLPAPRPLPNRKDLDDVARRLLRAQPIGLEPDGGLVLLHVVSNPTEGTYRVLAARLCDCSQRCLWPGCESPARAVPGSGWSLPRLPRNSLWSGSAPDSPPPSATLPTASSCRCCRTATGTFSPWWPRTRRRVSWSLRGNGGGKKPPHVLGPPSSPRSPFATATHSGLAQRPWPPATTLQSGLW